MVHNILGTATTLNCSFNRSRIYWVAASWSGILTVTISAFFDLATLLQGYTFEGNWFSKTRMKYNYYETHACDVFCLSKTCQS